MEKLDCFNEDKKCFIGLRYSCNYAEGASGIFINDLEGMSLKRFSTVANDEVHRGEDLYKILHDEAIQDVCNDLTGKLGESFNFHHTVERRRIGVTGKTFSGVVLPKGILLERKQYDQNQSLYVKSVSFTSDRNVTAAKYFIETAFGVTEKTVDIKAGANTVYLGIESNEDWVSIYFDSCFDIANQGHEYCGCEYACELCSCACGCFYGKLYNVTDETLGTREFQSVNGLSFDISCKCNDTNLICEFAQEMKFAVRMKIAVKVMTEVLVSDGVHPLVRNGKEDAQTLLTKWLGGVNVITGFEEKSEYWRLLDPIVQKAKSFLEKEGGACVSCNSEIKYFQSVP